MRPVAGVYEWPQAVGYSRAPFASLVEGAGALVAGPNGLILSRFGWADPVTGQVSNVYDPLALLGFVLPIYDMWNWQRVQQCGRDFQLRSAQQCVLGSQGNFPMRFALGSIAGARVWANPSDGSASCYEIGDAVVLDSSGQPVLDSDGNEMVANGVQFAPTPWVAMRTVGCGCVAIASSFVSPTQ